MSQWMSNVQGQVGENPFISPGDDNNNEVVDIVANPTTNDDLILKSNQQTNIHHKKYVNVKDIPKQGGILPSNIVTKNPRE